MPLELPDGTACFVDSNVLYYALVPTPPMSDRCLSLLDRAIAGRISIAVSIPVLSDTIHKVMISEAAQLTGRDRAGMVGYLGRHPEVVSRLVEYVNAMDRLRAVPMSILTVDDELLHYAARVAVRHGLLTNDAMIVALMERNRLTDLVTNDDDFDRVPLLTVWKPR
jgi:predicted nucleic acid-binding protein